MELNQLESQVSQLKAQQESGNQRKMKNSIKSSYYIKYIELKNVFIYKFSGGSLVSSLQAEIEQSTKTLTDLESETASARNQLTSLDAQKMKLVQEGNHK